MQFPAPELNRQLPSHLYIIGAGRSGTTLLAALIASHPSVSVSGELLDFARHWKQNRLCSCGMRLNDCEQWRAAGAIVETDGPNGGVLVAKQHESIERHRKVLQFLFKPSLVPSDYTSYQDTLFDAFGRGAIVVDASKYIARGIALAQSKRHRFRYVYLVRDARGVVHSLSKRGVQERRGLPSAIIYYLAVNVAAQIAVWTRLRGRSLKIRYEDLVSDPEVVLGSVAKLLGIDLTEVSKSASGGRVIQLGHMASGNRFRREGQVMLRADESWKREMRPLERLLIYFVCLPLQLLNRYRL